MSHERIPLSKVEGILMDAGEPEEIASRFQVSSTTVFLYKRLKLEKARKAHRALLAAGKMPVVLEDAKPTGLAPEDISAIRASNESSRLCAKRYSCSPSMIRMIRTGRTYIGV